MSNDLRNTVAKNWTAAEATLRAAGLLDAGGRGGRPISADCLPIRDGASEARDDDDDDDDESEGGVTREEAVTAATDAAAAVSGEPARQRATAPSRMRNLRRAADGNSRGAFVG